MTTELENELKEILLKSCEESEKFGYNAEFFRGKINRDGAVETIKFLIDRLKPSSKFIEFWNDSKLIFSAEALILENPKFRKLFTDDLLKIADERLKKHGYELKVKTKNPKDKKECPLCDLVFQGNGWDGIASHWRARHEKDTGEDYEDVKHFIMSDNYPPK